MFNGEEFLILIVIAAVVIGPERLPAYAEQLGRLVRQLKSMATGATKMVKEELGPDLGDIDLSQFDPRKYDPRRIVREALMEDILPLTKPAPRVAKVSAAAASRAAAAPTAAAAAPTAAAAAAVASSAATSTAEAGGEPSAGSSGTALPGAPDALALVPAGPAPFDDEAT